MSADVVDIRKARGRRERPASDFTIAELERALLVVHAALEERKRAFGRGDCRMRADAVTRLIDGFADYLNGRDRRYPRPPDEDEPEHAQ